MNKEKIIKLEFFLINLSKIQINKIAKILNRPGIFNNSKVITYHSDNLLINKLSIMVKHPIYSVSFSTYHDAVDEVIIFYQDKYRDYVKNRNQKTKKFLI